MGFTVGELAARLGGVVEGDADRALIGVRGLADAGPEHLSFLANRKYVRDMRQSQAGAILVGRHDDPLGHTVIRCRDPYVAFAQALRLFVPEQRPAPGVHPLAVVEGQAEGATVMPFAYVGPRATVGVGTVLQPGVYVGADAKVGRDCTLMAGSVVMDGCVVGDRVVLNPGAVVGAEGFGFARAPEGWVKIPQTGRALIGDDVELGANTCVDRAAMGDTVVGNGCKMDNLVQIGHGVTLGRNDLLVAYAAVAGTAHLGDDVTVAVRSTVLGHLQVGDRATVGAHSMVTSNIPAGAMRSGAPAIDHGQWLKLAAHQGRVPELVEAVRTLQHELAALKQELNELRADPKLTRDKP